MPNDLHLLTQDLNSTHEAHDRFADIYDADQMPDEKKTVDASIDWHQSKRLNNGRIESTNSLLQPRATEPTDSPGTSNPTFAKSS